jgi:uncharacterized protein (DUF362 family)
MKPLVSIVQSENIEERVRKSIDLLGGMGKFISKGDRVFIKPNLVYPEPPPLTTEVTTIATLVRMALEAGASRVLVGEGGAPACKRADSFTVRGTFAATGMGKAVEEAGGEIACMDEEEFDIVKVPDGVIYKEVKLYKSILSCNKIIGVPVMKTHYDTDVTLGIKGWHGVIADAEKFWKFHRDDIHQKLVDLLKAIRPCLCVIDGTVGMEGLGPLGGTDIRMNLTTAGADTVATDAVTASIMGFDPLEVEHIRIAHKQGLGEARLDHIDTVGSSVAEVKRDFVRPDVRLAAIYDNVTVIQGGVCRACKARTRWCLDQLHKLGKLNEKLTVIVGIDPFIPDPAEIEGRIVIVGECACFDAKSLRRLPPEKCMFIQGCPPVPVPAWVPHYLNRHKH